MINGEPAFSPFKGVLVITSASLCKSRVASNFIVYNFRSASVVNYFVLFLFSTYLRRYNLFAHLLHIQHFKLCRFLFRVNFKPIFK